MGIHISLQQQAQDYDEMDGSAQKLTLKKHANPQFSVLFISWDTDNCQGTPSGIFADRMGLKSRLPF